MFDSDIGVTCFDCSERIEVKEDFPPAVDVSDAIDGTDEGAVALLPRLLNDELIGWCGSQGRAGGRS